MVEGSHDETHPSPFADMNYPDGMRPNTAAVAQLALAIKHLCPGDGVLALAVAIKIDQGECSDAFGFIERERLDRERAAEIKRAAADARKNQ